MCCSDQVEPEQPSLAIPSQPRLLCFWSLRGSKPRAHRGRKPRPRRDAPPAFDLSDFLAPTSETCASALVPAGAVLGTVRRARTRPFLGNLSVDSRRSCISMVSLRSVVAAPSRTSPPDTHPERPEQSDFQDSAQRSACSAMTAPLQTSLGAVWQDDPRKRLPQLQPNPARGAPRAGSFLFCTLLTSPRGSA